MPGTPTNLPYWVSSEPVQWKPFNTAFSSLMTATATFVGTAIATTEASRVATASINTRLTEWYQSEVQPQVANAQNLAVAAANFLEDTFTSGVHWYVMPPSFGGLDAVEDSVLPGLTDRLEANAPRFSEDAYAGGILVLLTGPPYTLFQVSSVLINALSARPETAQRGLQQLSTESAVAAPVMTALSDLVTLPQATWSSTTTTFKNLFSGSAVAGLLGTAFTFPQSWVQSTTVEVTGIEPPTARVKQAVNLKLIGRGFLGADVIRVNTARFTPTAIDPNGNSLTVRLPASVTTAPGPLRINVVRNNDDVAWYDLEVQPFTSLESLAELQGSELYGWHQFDLWAPFSGLDPWKGVAQLIPGAAQVTNNVINILDKVGDPDTGAAINNFAVSALQASRRSADTATNRAKTDLQRIQTGIQQFSTETAALSATVLVIPPELGGNHQLGYALRQGLNGHALNSPAIDPDAAVAGLFICAGDTDRSAVITALNKVSSVLQMAPWSPLA